MITRKLGNWLIGMGRRIGRSEGDSELAVILSDHTIKARLVDPNRDDLAWDPDLYRYGNVFLKGYANPIKPSVNHNPELENPDTVDIDRAGKDARASDDGDEPEVIASSRYKSYMKQELVESLLNPREQWRLLAYAIIALGVLMVINLVVSASAAGAF